MRDYFNTAKDTRFVFPIDGDYLNENDGEASIDGLEFTVTAISKPNCKLEINGVPAKEDGGVYTASIKIGIGPTRLTLNNVTDGSKAEITVYYLEGTTKKYRISVDDNILLFADITKNQDKYTSIFNNPYLAVYKKAHELYGAKVHLNVFWEHNREAAAFFSTERPDFDLSMMTDKFKDEWEENADWLKLSFHARHEMPDKPYKYATAEAITRDYNDVKAEILRFAGEKAFSNDVTTIHWGEANPECVKALTECGIKALAGYFEFDELSEPLVAYYAPGNLTEHVGERDFWRDNEMGVTFARIDRVTNIGSLEEIMSDLEKITAHPHRGGFVSLMIHEQYFHSDYKNYLPDFEERVLLPAKFLFDGGYQGSFLKEVLFK